MGGNVVQNRFQYEFPKSIVSLSVTTERYGFHFAEAPTNGVIEIHSFNHKKDL